MNCFDQGQAGIQLLTPLFIRLVAEPRPHTGVARRRFTKPLQECPHIETGAADQQGKHPPSITLVDCGSSMAPEETGIEGFVGIDKIDEMMDDPFAGKERGLVSAHIHSAIDLA